MDLSLLTENTIIAFLLILFRISGMLISAPLFNMPSVPNQVKIGLAFTIALVFFPLHSANLILPHDIFTMSMMVIQETIIGILIGFTASLTFIAIQMAGEFLSTQMGLSVAHMIDPLSHQQSPVVGQFFYYFAASIFLTLNIHHGLIMGLERSFDSLPLGHFIGEGHLTAALMTQRFIQLGSDMFLMALTVGVPVIGIMLCMEIGLSFVAKVMPQMNIFTVAIPAKVMLGLYLVFLSLPYFGDTLGTQYSHLVQVLMGLYKT